MPVATAPAATVLLLIVSADPRLQRSLSLDLATRTYRVGVATTEREALAALRCEQPQVVLLDLDHPPIDPEVVARALEARGPLVPMILLGRDKQRLRERARELRAVAYAVTPFALGTLPAM
jgi:DNA-binding response OmpR family regulator